MIDTIIFEKHNFKGYTLVDGFPGYGLVGTIAANYLVDKLKMDFIGYIESKHFPPVSAIHDGKPMPPLRIYKNDKHKLVVFISEFMFPKQLVYTMADTMYNWCEKNKIKKIVSMGGISIRGKQDEVFGLSSDAKELRVLGDSGVIPIKEGATTGINALLLIKSSMTGKIPVVSLLAESKPDFVDPLGAALVLTALSDYLNVIVDTKELIKEASIIESKLKESISSAESAEKAHPESSFSNKHMYA
jgi:uncharacterized protein